MWRTPVGERVLDGAEARLIRETIATLADWLPADEYEGQGCGFATGIEVFDSLAATQKLVLVEQVARHLLTDTPEALPLNAATESTVGAIFECLREQIEVEIEAEHFTRNDPEWDSAWDSDLPSWRALVLEATRETLDPDDELSECDLPYEDCDDVERWDELIEMLADRILWDRDYEMAELFLDEEPTMVAAKKAVMGIDEDYFVELAPDPRDEELVGIRSSILRLLKAKPR